MDAANRLMPPNPPREFGVFDKAVRPSPPVRAVRVWENWTITGGPELPKGGFIRSRRGRGTGLCGAEGRTRITSGQIEPGERAHWIT